MRVLRKSEKKSEKKNQKFWEKNYNKIAMFYIKIGVFGVKKHKINLKILCVASKPPKNKNK